MKIGIYGGTFDPIHKAHISLALTSYKQAKLDKLYFMPNFKAPHKENKNISSYQDRINMLKLAISKYNFFDICEIEKERKANSYTSISLKILKEKYPNSNLYFIMGADSFYELHTWYEYEKIFKLATLLVIDRDYENKSNSLEKLKEEYEKKYLAKIQIIQFIKSQISSRQIRLNIKNNIDCSNLIDEKVFKYIKEKNLYK